MHPTRDTAALIQLNLAGGRVMPGVRCLLMDKVHAVTRFISLMVALALFCGCGGVSFPELQGVTRAEVRTNHNELIKEISDPEQIRRLVEFVNARRTGWGARIDGVPVPRHVVNFYEGEEFAGHFGWGRDFFETQRDSRGFFSREADPKEFQRIVEVDDK
jgi:hypothetical protein